MGMVFADVGTFAARLVLASHTHRGKEIRGGNIPHRPSVARRGDVAQEQSAAVVIDDGRRQLGSVAAREGGIQNGQRAIASDRGNGQIACQAPDADRLPVVVEAERGLAEEGNVLKRLAVDGVAGLDAHLEAANQQVADQQGAVHVTVGQIQAHRSLAIL